LNPLTISQTARIISCGSIGSSITVWMVPKTGMKPTVASAHANMPDKAATIPQILSIEELILFDKI
jgi:hypothetical protein